MTDVDPLRARNRRTGITVFLIFLMLTAVAVAFVILRKFGYA